MRITLDQTEIEQALRDFVGAQSMGVDLSNRDIAIKLIAARGDNGHRAEIEIGPKKADSTDEAEGTEPADGDQAISFDFEDD